MKGIDILKDLTIDEIVSNFIPDIPPCCPENIGIYGTQNCHICETCQECWTKALESEVQCDMSLYLDSYVEVSNDKEQWEVQRLFNINKDNYIGAKNNYPFVCYDYSPECGYDEYHYTGWKYARPKIRKKD